MTLLLAICWIILLAPLAIVLAFLGKHKEFWKWLGIVLLMLIFIGAAFVAFCVIMLAGAV